MDSSEQFIKMCAKAQEIQKLWKHEIGDFYRETIPRYDLIDNHLIRQEGEHENRIGVIDEDFEFANSTVWLPRQDQLQEIYESLTTCGWGASDKECLELLNILEFSNPGNLFSKEYVGLLVIMQKLNKTWNGEDWV